MRPGACSIPPDSAWGSSLLRVGDRDVEFSGGEVDHRDVVARGAVAAGAAFGSLDEAVEAFEQAVADLAGPPLGDPQPVLLDHVGEVVQRSQVGVAGCLAPGAQVRLG